MPIERGTVTTEIQEYKGETKMHRFAQDSEGETCVRFGSANNAILLGLDLEQIFGLIINSGLKPVLDDVLGSDKETSDDELEIWVKGSDKGRLGEFVEELADKLVEQARQNLLLRTGKERQDFNHE